MKGAGEHAELLRRQMKFGLQRCCQYGRDRPEGLAHRERGRQRQQHDPRPGMAGWGVLSRRHAASVTPLLSAVVRRLSELKGRTRAPSGASSWSAPGIRAWRK